MTLFFEIHRDWQEDYSSLTIKRNAGTQISHLDVYEKPCDEAYLRNFKIVRFKRGYLPDLLPNNLGWYLASPRLCKILGNINSEIKAFIQPITCMQFPNCEEAFINYSLVSAARVLDCLDVSSSALTWSNIERTGLQKYTYLPLLRNRIPAMASFFSVAKVVSTFVVSDNLKKEISHNEISGVAFRACVLR